MNLTARACVGPEIGLRSRPGSGMIILSVESHLVGPQVVVSPPGSGVGTASCPELIRESLTGGRARSGERPHPQLPPEAKPGSLAGERLKGAAPPLRPAG